MNFRNAERKKWMLIVSSWTFCRSSMGLLQSEGKMASNSLRLRAKPMRNTWRLKNMQFAGEGTERQLHKSIRIIILGIGKSCDVFCLSKPFIEKVSVADWKNWKLIWKNTGRKCYRSQRGTIRGEEPSSNYIQWQSSC